MSVASGAKFSPAYGFYVFTDNKKEYTLMEIESLDKVNFKVNMPNPKFMTFTLEIGSGKSYLGNTKNTRENISKEYTKYHYGKLLENLPSLIK